MICISKFVPVEPSQEALGGADQLHHRGEEVVRGLARDAAVVRWAFPAVRRGHV